MSSGRINSEESMKTAARALKAAGNSWAEIERMAHRDENGVYVVSRRTLEHAARTAG